MDNSENKLDANFVLNTTEQAKWLKDQIEDSPTQNKALKDALESYKDAQKTNLDQID